MTAAPPRLGTRGEEERGRPRAYAAAGALLPYLAAVLATLLVCRGMVRGRYFGDIGDARWTVSLHEHWYRVWQGEEGFRDLVSYAPLRSVLGTSDAFFVQGQLYTVLRTFGLDLAPAWAWTQVVVFLIGTLGVAALSLRLLGSTFSQAAFTFLTCTSYTFVVDLVHVQLIGMLSCAWVVVGIIDLARGQRVLRSFALVLLAPPLIALSSWYALALLGILVGVTTVYLLLVSDHAAVGRGVRVAVWSFVETVRRPRGAVVGIASLAGSLVLFGMTVWIYLPARNILPKPTWEETTLYSPWYSDILNAAWAGGGIWAHFYATHFSPETYNVEQPHGFTPLLFMAFMVLGLLNLRRAVVGPPGAGTAWSLPGARALAASWLTVLTVVLLFIVDERRLGPFEAIWTYVPGMDSIRAPFRIQTFTYSLAFLIVLRSIEIAVDRLRIRFAASRRRSASLVVVVVAVGIALTTGIFVEGVRPFVSTWGAGELLDQALVNQIPAVRSSCDAVVVDTPGIDKVKAQIDGVTLATLAGVVTPQGYGRAEPLGHPTWEAQGPALAAWMRSLGYTGRVCSVSASATVPTVL